MAHLALFLSNAIWVLWMLCGSCTAPAEPALIVTFYPGTRDTAQITGYLSGKEHGTWKKYYPDGRLCEIREYNNGKKTGRYLAFWENGNPKLQYFFRDGEYEGRCSEWNREGLLIKEMNYSKGYEYGSQRVFYDNGKIRSNYVIKDGRRYGMLGTKNCVNAADSIPVRP